jgi:hypothetical protein
MPPEVNATPTEPHDPRVLDLSDIDADPPKRVNGNGADDTSTTIVDDSEGPSAETIQRATEMGWAPKDKWRGDPNAWIDAAEFAKRGDFVLPIVKKERDELREETRALKAQMAELTRSTQEVVKWQREQAAARALREKNGLISDRKEALEAGDMDRVNEIDMQLADVRDKERTAATPAAKPQDTESARVFADFLQDNPWVKTDVDLQEAMTIESTNLRAAGTTKSGRAFLDAVADRVKRMYPDKFRPQRRAQMNETDTMHGDASNGGVMRTFSNLKSDRQALAKKWNEQGVLTIKEYLAQCEPSDFRS